MQEIRTCIVNLRGERGRDGKYRDTYGNLLPTLLAITVRGQPLVAENDVNTLRVNLGDSLENMNWFLRELWPDAHSEAASAPEVDPGQNPEPLPFRDQQQPLSERFTQEMLMALSLVRQEPHVRGVTFDARHGRARVFVDFKRAPQYFPIKDFKTHLEADLSADEWHGCLVDVVDEIRAYLAGEVALAGEQLALGPHDDDE